MLYAIGEILIVTFGIFIAIQLNNWNEEEKTNRVVDRIFTEIQNDLEKNRTNLTNSIKWYDKRDSLITLVKDRKLTSKIIAPMRIY